MNELLSVISAGLANGAALALVGIGLVVIYRTTRVLNFAHGVLVLAGAYLTYELHVQVGLSYYLAVPLAVVLSGVIGYLLDVSVIRRMRGRPHFAIIMATFGVSIVVTQIVEASWGVDTLQMNDPIGTTSWLVDPRWLTAVLVAALVAAVAQALSHRGRVPMGRIIPLALWGVAVVLLALTVVLGRRTGDGAVVSLIQIVAVVVILVVGVLLALFNRSRVGTVSRAMAVDEEAAIALGVSPNLVIGLAWGMAGALAGLAGILLSSGGHTFDTTLGNVLFYAFPAIILGGLDSTSGAIVGGLLVGVTQQLVFGYQYRQFGGFVLTDYLGANFHLVFPYLVLVVVLLVRPYGIWGTKEVRRS